MKNAGYKIIQTEVYNETNDKTHAIVIGHNQSKNCPAPWVTWELTGEDNYFWGHYFEHEKDARKDYHERLAESYNKPF